MSSPESFVLSRYKRLAELQTVYDAHLFLDAFKLSVDSWTDLAAIDELTAEEMILAGRLASRIGGMRISRHLYRKARERAPKLPLVRYFTRHISGSKDLLLDQLLEFEKDPELGGDDAELRASWLGAHAYIFAVLRDFTRAEDLLNEAHKLSPASAWLLSQEADVMGMADKWDESVQSAEVGLKADPRSPWPMLSLANALLNLGRVREAADRLAEAAAETQFYQIVQTACWYQCALAETLEGSERREKVEAARSLAERIESMAPLADREFRTSLARTWLDIAELSDDHAAMEKWALEARSAFHRNVLANLKANPDGKRIRLPYRRTIQKHVECVPTSICSALSATGVEILVEALARDVTFGGTTEWAAADWLCRKGFHVRHFSATAEITVKLIEAKIGFTISWDDDESGHTVAIVGVDHAAGTAIAHDPNSFRSTEYLLSSFSEQYGPLGLTAMAVVPATLANILDAILPPESQLVEAAEAQEKALTIHGLSEGRAIVEGLERRFPDHPGTTYLRAIQNLEDGRIGRAFEGFRRTFTRFPNAPKVRARLMSACRSLGDSALLRETLRSVVETGKVPGVDSQSEWATPHPRYFYEYADLLRSSAETWKQSETHLRSVLRENWRSAGAWHVLADLRWVQRKDQSAALAFRIASSLAEHNEHYASAYADVLYRSGRLTDALEWLRTRAEKLGASVHGVSTWITYISSLEDWGKPVEALQVCRAALGRFGNSALLLSFAVPFFGRMGEWQEAENWFETLKSSGADASSKEAAVYFFEMRGMTAKALEHADAWVCEAPLSISARKKLLALTAEIHGKSAALSRAAAWMRERPENEDIEDLFCEHADFPIWRKMRVLKARLKRNRDDAWAWRELVFAAISEFESSDGAYRRRLQQRINKYLAEVSRLTSADAATLRAMGIWLEAQGEWQQAKTVYLEAIRIDPGNSWTYRRALEIAARFPVEEQRAVWAAIEPVWIGQTGRLSNSLDMMRRLTDLFGPRETETIIQNWQKHHADDPNVAEAMADLLLDFGHGRSDARRALELLQPAVERYLYDSGLRFSLAKALRATGDDAAAGRVFEELVRRRPDNLSALIQLAWIREREGQTDEALRILARAAEQEPQNADPLDTQAQILIQNRRFDEARAILQSALGRLPASVRIYQRTIALFNEMGEDEKAVGAARQGVEAYPRGAYLWLLLGKTLREHAHLAAPGEVELCLRRSLQFNRALFESADWLAVIMAEQRNYAEAFNVLSNVEQRLVDPSPAQGRRAWIRRQAGGKREAITDLAAILEKYPGYSWGWNVLLDWLEEDKEWDLAKKQLGVMPPQMIAHTTFRKDRLLLLEKAGAEKESLDPEWIELLDDFPENIPLHLNRFDSLQKANRWKEAAEALDRVSKIADDDVYFMARLADARYHEGRIEEALESALIVCFAPVEHSVWPVNRVWTVFGEASKEGILAERFRAKLDQGAQPTPQALRRYAEHLVKDADPTPRLLKVFRQTRLNHVTRRIFALMKVIERSSWRNDFAPGDLFAVLNENGYPRLVIGFWKAMPADAQTEDSDAWAQAGRAMINRRRYTAARALFLDWRNRRGVGMWSLANYMRSLSRFRHRDLREVIASCRDALANLRHDHCARYLVCLQAEACALGGDKDGLLAVWNDRREYFKGELKKDEYFNAPEKYLMREIPDLVEALEQKGLGAYSRGVWHLRYRRVWKPKGRQIWRILLRIIIWLGIIGIMRVIFSP
jgi:tetratricopeptide (TPR) repeat protein